MCCRYSIAGVRALKFLRNIHCRGCLEGEFRNYLVAYIGSDGQYNQCNNDLTRNWFDRWRICIITPQQLDRTCTCILPTVEKKFARRSQTITPVRATIQQHYHNDYNGFKLGHHRRRLRVHTRKTIELKWDVPIFRHR